MANIRLLSSQGMSEILCGGGAGHRGLWLQDLQSPTDIIPDDVKIERLNYRQLSRATGISLHVVQRCVRETVLLYCHLLRNKAHVSFAFKNIGVMTYEDDFLCMRFLEFGPARSADFGSETTAHGIQVLPRFSSL
ncbi:coiled-coil domain-containing protein 81-like [Gallus gallus]|uniref:coiled-coil domain-containing protein 81-like n=1 Tax=Gallus gallus TaxID=9031 RepID=UPI001F02BC3B|nr:coiled-coil domain-containing protein 81-like [Gallus gallus]